MKKNKHTMKNLDFFISKRVNKQISKRKKAQEKGSWWCISVGVCSREKEGFCCLLFLVFFWFFRPHFKKHTKQTTIDSLIFVIVLPSLSLSLCTLPIIICSSFSSNPNIIHSFIHSLFEIVLRVVVFCEWVSYRIQFANCLCFLSLSCYTSLWFYHPRYLYLIVVVTNPSSNTLYLNRTLKLFSPFFKKNKIKGTALLFLFIYSPFLLRLSLNMHTK